MSVARLLWNVHMRFAKALGEAIRGWFSLSYLEFVDALMLAAAPWEGRQISGFKSSSAFQMRSAMLPTGLFTI